MTFVGLEQKEVVLLQFDESVWAVCTENRLQGTNMGIFYGCFKSPGRERDEEGVKLGYKKQRGVNGAQGKREMERKRGKRERETEVE